MKNKKSKSIVLCMSVISLLVLLAGCDVKHHKFEESQNHVATICPPALMNTGGNSLTEVERIKLAANGKNSPNAQKQWTVGCVSDAGDHYKIGDVFTLGLDKNGEKITNISSKLKKTDDSFEVGFTVSEGFLVQEHETCKNGLLIHFLIGRNLPEVKHPHLAKLEFCELDRDAPVLIYTIVDLVTGQHEALTRHGSGTGG